MLNPLGHLLRVVNLQLGALVVCPVELLGCGAGLEAGLKVDEAVVVVAGHFSGRAVGSDAFADGFAVCWQVSC